MDMNTKLMIIASGLFAISEALSLIPAIKANGIFQLVVNVLRTITGKKSAE